MLERAINENRDKLENYIHITHENIQEMRKGGYIKYFNTNFELKHGGIVIGYRQRNRPIELQHEDLLLTEFVILVKNNIGIQKISYLRNHIFFMKHRTFNDKLRDIFLKAAS